MLKHIPKTGTKYTLRRIRRTGSKIMKSTMKSITVKHIQKHMKLVIQETSSSYGKVSIPRTMTRTISKHTAKIMSKTG